MVDWDFAVSTARRLLRPGPELSYADAAEVVVQLRALGVDAERHVRAFTGLASGEEPGPVTVLDRPGWVQANVDGFRVVLEPVVERLGAKRRSAPGGGVVTAVGARVTGAQVGGILAFLGSRVLGQYEIFLPPGQGTGRLSLVAPNIVETERALGADPRDFRLWVCLHEATHRTQFTAVPWLREHVMAEVRALVDASDLDAAALRARLRAAVGTVADMARGKEAPSLLEVMQTPEQKVVLDRITAFMTLLEGHAEYVMDGVGPTVVPSVATIRERFDLRRRGAGSVDRLLRRLLGIDLKMRQYAEGNRFVGAVVDAVGMDGFNRVWTGPETLPTKDEIADPGAWVARLHGRGEPVAVTA